MEMNLPNKLTLSRVLMVPVFVLVLTLVDSLTGRLLAAGVFGLASLTDFFDGRLARRRKAITSFGRFMDPLADKLLVLSGLVSFATMGLAYVSAPLVLAIVGREAFVTGLRATVNRRGGMNGSSTLAKWKTTLQMSFITLVLCWLSVESWLGPERSAGWAGGGHNVERFLTGFLWVTAAITIASGLDYLLRNRKLLASVLVSSR
jgi:CDP-diacylglycerol--glycerol-3-phosphate 3-phosphatidyltransferase